MQPGGEAAGPWLPLHQVVKTVLSELRNPRAAESTNPAKPGAGPAAKSCNRIGGSNLPRAGEHAKRTTAVSSEASHCTVPRSDARALGVFAITFQGLAKAASRCEASHEM